MSKLKPSNNLSKRKAISKKKRQRRKLIFTIVAMILLLVLLIVVFAFSKLNKLHSIKIEMDDLKTNELDLNTQKGMKGYRTIAMFGLDNRSNGNFERGNSDTIIIASINKDTGEIKMASVYRDTYLDIGDDTFRKANAAYATGGPQQAINMLNTNLDLNITDYVAVDFNALVKAIDLLGGVEIDVAPEEAVHLGGYIDEIAELTGQDATNISPGLQLLNGVQATAYARIRYTTGVDYKRTERQRLVITKMFEKAKKANLMTLNGMLDEVLPQVSTSLSTTELLGLVSQAAKYSMGENTGFPFASESGNVGSGSLGDVVIPIDLEANVVELHQFLYANDAYVASDTVKGLSSTIHNNTGR
ncbi:LCP family protein [Lachnospiraceae bacterium ZAX-1]